MKINNHTLGALKFDISFYAEEQAVDLHKQISRLSNNSLYSIINKVCDEELPDQRVFVQIEKLEIDLGLIPYAEVDQLLPNKLYDSFKQTLRHRLLVSNKFSDIHQAAATQTGESRHEEGLLFIFLQQGILPWWATNEAERQLEPIFLKLLRNDPQKTVAAIFTDNNFSNIIQRIVYQFSDTLLKKLVEVLNPAKAQALIQCSAILTGSPALAQSGIHLDKKSQWKMLLAFLNPHASRTTYDERALIEFIIDRLAAENNLSALTLLVGIQRDSQSRSSSKDEKYAFHHIIEALLEEELKKGGEETVENNDREQNSPKIMEDLRPFINELSPLKQHDRLLYENVISFTINYNEKWEGNNDFDTYALAFFNYMLTKPLPKKQVFDLLENTFRKFGFKPAKKIDKQLLYANNVTLDKTETYYIENAGLVLLNPFFLTFYEKLELMNKNEFKSKHAADRAIHLLQFLVNGQEGHVEHSLLLNKILCGRDIHEPIEKEILLSEMEKEISTGLLNAVIDNWRSLKNSSIDTLRTEFLQRNGKLKYYNGEWVLRIEHNGRSDYLLDTLPWSFIMIKNSWMPEILNVEWI